MIKRLILTQKSNQSNFRRKHWLFYVYYDVCNEKNKDSELIRFVNFKILPSFLENKRMTG